MSSLQLAPPPAEQEQPELSSLQLAPPEQLGQVRAPVLVLKLASLRGFQRRKPATKRLHQQMKRRQQQR